MKIKENRTTYHCDYCKKHMFVKHAMEKHEVICDNNPVNIPKCFDCGGCEHLSQTKKTVMFYRPSFPDGEDYGYEREVDVFQCDYLNTYMFPWKIERKGLHVSHPDTFEDQEPMPKICEHFKEQKYF